jgi:hypothetical protein
MRASFNVLHFGGMSLNISSHMTENTHVHVSLNLTVTYAWYSVQNLIIWKKALVSNKKTDFRFGNRRRCAASFALELLYPPIKELNGPKILFLHTK